MIQPKMSHKQHVGKLKEQSNDSNFVLMIMTGVRTFHKDVSGSNLVVTNRTKFKASP